MGDIIVVGILVLLVGAAVFYLWKEKKKGNRCVGCPSAGCCSKKPAAVRKMKKVLKNGKIKEKR